MSASHHYHLRPADPNAHIFEVSVTVAEPDPVGQAFTMPDWIPGSYMIRDLARNIVSIGASANGEPVELTKLDKSTWQAGPCESPLTVTARIHGFDLNVRGAYLDEEHGFFDGACVFPAVVGQENRECRLEISRPPGKVGGDWRVATAMRQTDGDAYDFGRYVASDYAELIDHPVEMGNMLIGEFDVAGIPHAVAVTGHTHVDMARICHDLARLCETEVAFLGKPEDLDRYLFLLTVRESGYGGLEHRWSSSLVCSRKDLPRRGDSTVTDDYRKLLGLCSHEYFHLWNVKRMKPDCFTPYDLRGETHTGLLWVFEGITSYYDDLLLARSGLISRESYLELLAKTITRVQRTPGRLCQSLEESSFDAWTKLYKQDTNSPNAIISYYSKGSLVALALDLTIRKGTGGECSLDDVMQECWRRYGESGEGMPERGIESIARSVSGLELADFFERYVRGTVDPPLETLLKTVGVNYRLRPADDSKDAGGKPPKKPGLAPLPWLGATLASPESSSRFSTVLTGSPAERGGIAPGDEAVAIDGLRLTADNLDQRLRDYHPGDTVTVTVFRDHRLIRHRVRLGKAPDDTCYLEFDADADPESTRERDRWLSG